MKPMRAAVVTALFILLAASAAQADILKSPYLQNVSRTGITVCLETNSPEDMTVEWGAGEQYGDQLIVGYAQDPDFPEGKRYVYKARLEGLAQGTTYHYRVTHGGDVSEDKTFITAPDNMSDFAFVAYGDSRGGSPEALNPEHVAVAEKIAEIMPMFYINTGDFVSSGENYLDWDTHFVTEGDLMGYAPMYPVYGNHEEDFDLETLFSGYGLWKYYFDTNHEDDGTWYSFDYGNVHFIILDVVRSWLIIPGTQQYRWLQADLQDYVDNPHTNFLLAFFHYPPFSWKPERSGDFITQTVVMPMLKRHGLDAIITGHDHYYARREVDGLTEVISGGGGAGLYDLYDDVENRFGYKAAAMDHHVIEVNVSSTLMQLDVWSTTTGQLIDSFNLEADQPPVPGDDDVDDDADDDVDDDLNDDVDDDLDDDLNDDVDDDDDDTQPAPAQSDGGDDDDDDGACCG